ncbi:hypothetical protein M011DRAFT_478712 [Sporormia fimetaria CBS 119925]|uniref:EKC/KEOPS complex subunit GON7 n=1 Tax=Sporormia fimetaria CBS 119925 TaxID=1340428 RepID=A0A6A6V7T2_9PLEO|nr:hypothetical protein M011DRAFT_478712 [Sporormia fimetaria CBS 119925]
MGAFIQNVDKDLGAALSTDERVAFLASLQEAVKHIQGDLNDHLTQLMEKDKAANGKVDASKAEDNYGEEVVEED